MENKGNFGASLQKDFDPIWKEDFLDLQYLSKSAFILRQLFRVKRDRNSNEVNLSDLEIHEITGFGRNTIARAKAELIKSDDLVQKGYHVYLVPSFKKFSTGCAKTEQPPEKQLRQNGASGCAKTEHRLRQNGASVAPKRSNPYIRPDLDIKDQGKASFSEDEINDLRVLYPFREKRDDLKQHFLNRGFSEQESAHLLEKVYSQELTGGRV